MKWPPQRRWLLPLVALLLIQGLYPRGFMPGSVEDGWPVVLCPSVWPAAFIDARAAGHHHHGDHATADPEPQATTFCELGSGLDQQALLADQQNLSAAPAPETHQDLAPLPGLFNRRHFRLGARAPPTA